MARRWNASTSAAASGNAIALTLSLLATVFGLFWLVWILWTALFNGLAAMNLALFTQMTPAPGENGGLLNAFFGSLTMSLLAIIIGAPIGIAAGTYLAEYARKKAIGETIRFINDILLSAPSIVLGLFIYTIVVRAMGHFSAIAGALALALIVIPVVVRTTDEMLQLVPAAMREAALSLGVPQWKMTLQVLVSIGRARHCHRCAAGAGANQRRNGAAALHRIEQPVLEFRSDQADGQRAGRDLPVRDEPVRFLALAGMGGRVHGHDIRVAAVPGLARTYIAQQGCQRLTPGRSPSAPKAMDGREGPTGKSPSAGRSPSVPEATDGREGPPQAMDGRERPAQATDGREGPRHCNFGV
jgi:ABC-type tungstate transport system substrate-binding protein